MFYHLFVEKVMIINFYVLKVMIYFIFVQKSNDSYLLCANIIKSYFSSKIRRN